MKKYQGIKWIVIGGISLMGFNAPVVSAQEQTSSTREALNEELKMEKTIESSEIKAFPNTLKLPRETKEESIELTSEKAEIEVGQTLQMNAVIMPENSFDQIVTWTSSDDTLATVSKEGLVTAVKAGSVSIAVKTQSGQTASRLLTIQEKPKTKTTDKEFGTVPWTWEEETGTVIFGGGEFPAARVNLDDRPSEYSDNIQNIIEESNKLNGKKIHHIKFTEIVQANYESSYLFAGLSELETIENASLLNTKYVRKMDKMFYNVKNLTKLDVSDWDTSYVMNMESMFEDSINVTELDVSNWDTKNVTNMKKMFSGLDDIIELDVSKWDIRSVITMQGMFSGLSSLTELDVSKWDTRNVTTMQWMFSGLSSLTELDVSKWDTRNVTTMQGMFSGLSSLTELDVSKWDTRNVTTMQGMFSGLSSLTELDVSKWDTRNVTTMQGMFSRLSSVKELDVSRWDTKNVTSMSGMFGDLHSLAKLDVSNWNTSSVTTMDYTFSEVSSLTELDVSKWDTRSVTTMQGMFFKLSSVKELDVSQWNTSNVTSMSRMFSSAKNVIELNLSQWDTKKVENMSDMFFGARRLKKLDVSNWNTSGVTTMEYTFCHTSDLEELDVSQWNTSSVTDMNSMFYEASVKELNVSNWDTSSVTDMNCMFYEASNITKLDVSKWNTGNVTDMKHMFYRASSLKELDVSRWDTSNVTNMSNLFFATRITTLDVSNWSTGNVRDMSRLFNGPDVTELDVSRWDTSNVRNMEKMFFGLKNVTKLDVSNWDTSCVGSMQGMFSHLENVTELDVSKWDTSNVSNMKEMFYFVMSVKELDVSKWDTSNVSNMSNLFLNVHSVEKLDVSRWNTRNVTDMSSMFVGVNVAKLDVSMWDIKNVTNMERMFSSAKRLIELDLSHWDTTNIKNMKDMLRVGYAPTIALDSLILGEKTRLAQNSGLPENYHEPYTGRWTLVSSNQENSYSGSYTLMQNYDGSKPGKYVREKRAVKIPVTGVELTPKTVDLFVEEETTLQTKITPDNADNQNITYMTSDASIATVSDNGVVKGIKAGTATITATTEDGGFQATSTINVSQNSKMLIDLFYLGIDEYVTGEVETDLGAKKVQLIVNGEVIGTTNVYRDGSFELDTQGMITKPTDKVEVVALDRKNQELERLLVTIEEKSYSLLTNPFILFEDTKVTGQTDYFHTHVALVIEGEEIERKILPASRQYSFEVEALVEYEDDQVEIVGYRYDSEITRKEVTIQTPVIEMEIESYAVGQTFITGKVTGKSAKNVRLYVNRRRQQTLKIAEDGTFSLLGVSILSPKDKVEISVLNDQGIEVQRFKVTVTH